MLGLLLGVAAQLGALLGRSGVGGAGAEAGDRGGRVTVLTRVSRQLLARQLPGRPALIERVLENVPLGAGGLDSVPDALAHSVSPLFGAGSAIRIVIRSGDASPTPGHRRAGASARASLGRPREPTDLDGGADRGRPGAGPLLRLRPAQQRPHAPLRVRVGPPLPRGGPGDDRGAGAALPVRRRLRGGGSRDRTSRDRLPGGARRRPGALARLRLRGLAQPLPLGEGRGPALVSLRRGVLPRYRGGDPGGAARARRAAGAARADAAGAPHRRPRGDGDRPQRRADRRRREAVDQRGRRRP